jgi:hypothetical protein
VKLWNWQSRPALLGSHAQNLRAARQRKRREEVEFLVKVATPIVTLIAVLIALYQAELATVTANTIVKNSLREAIAADRKDEDRLQALTSEVLNEIKSVPESAWLGPDASESEFDQGKRDTSDLVQALTKKIDGAKAEMFDPNLWQFFSLAEHDFSADIDFDLAADGQIDKQDLTFRKRLLKITVQGDTLRLRQALEYTLRTLDARLSSEIDRLDR